MLLLKMFKLIKKDKKLTNWHFFVRDDTHINVHVKLSISQDPTPLVHLRPEFFHPLDLRYPISKNSPLQMITNQLKENVIQ